MFREEIRSTMPRMLKQDYWRFGLPELTASAVCGGAAVLVSRKLEIAPAWWFLNSRDGAFRSWNRLDIWKIYENQGGYAGHALGSTLGWLAVGVVSGIITSNVFYRGKSSLDEDYTTPDNSAVKSPSEEVFSDG